MARHIGAMALALFIAPCAMALAQDYPDGGNDQLQARIQRLERDMRDLQQEIYRGQGGAPRTLTPAPASADVPPAQAAPLAQRVADMEDTLQRLTGQIEELQNQNRLLTTKVDRLQRALDFQQGTTPSGAAPQGDSFSQGSFDTPTANAPAPSAQPRTSVPGLAPGPSALGTIPQNTPMPVPKPGATGEVAAGGGAPVGTRTASLPPATGDGAQAEYDSAMVLLRKGQYAPAQQAFRAFADTHPGHPHAADALYWTGDIAYSARRDYAAAALAFAELVKKYGRAARAPEGMLKLGLSFLGLGKQQEGCATLAALPVRYANAAPALIARAAAERKRAACS